MSKNRRKKIKDVENIAKRYVDLLEDNNFMVKEAYIFGSYARGNFHKESDIDIAIVSKNLASDWDKKENYLWTIRRKINPRIEPIGYAPKDFNLRDPLVWHIRSEGIKVK